LRAAVRLEADRLPALDGAGGPAGSAIRRERNRRRLRRTLGLFCRAQLSNRSLLRMEDRA
jgi:hypothetical protein